MSARGVCRKCFFAELGQADDLAPVDPAAPLPEAQEIPERRTVPIRLSSLFPRSRSKLVLRSCGLRLHRVGSFMATWTWVAVLSIRRAHFTSRRRSDVSARSFWPVH